MKSKSNEIIKDYVETSIENGCKNYSMLIDIRRKSGEIIYLALTERLSKSE